MLADPEGNEFASSCGASSWPTPASSERVVFEPAQSATGYFWGEAIGWPVVYDEDGDVAIRAPDGVGPFITFGPPGVTGPGKNRLHLDLAPLPDEAQAAEVERLLALGREHDRHGQGDVAWVVLAIPTATSSACSVRSEGISCWNSSYMGVVCRADARS